MFALAKIAVLVLVFILALALTAEARELLQDYDGCWNGMLFPSMIICFLSTWRPQLRWLTIVSARTC